MGLARYAANAGKILLRRRISKRDMRLARQLNDESRLVSAPVLYKKYISMTIDGPQVMIEHYRNGKMVSTDNYNYDMRGLLFSCNLGGVEYKLSGRFWGAPSRLTT